jgi:hypothetical protein
MSGIEIGSSVSSVALATRVAKSGDTMSGLLQFTGTDHAGLRLNNLTTTQRNLLSPSIGMLLANITTGKPNYYNGVWNQVELIQEAIGEAFNEVWTDLSDWTSVGTPTASVAGGQLTIAGVASIILDVLVMVGRMLNTLNTSGQKQSLR